MVVVDSCSTEFASTLPLSELLLQTGSIERIVIYLVSHEKRRGEAADVMEDVGILSRVSPRDLPVVHAQSSVGPSGAC